MSGTQKRDHGEGSISKRSDGKWTARIMVGYQQSGKPRIKAFYGDSEQDVKRKLKDFKREIGNLPNSEIAKLTLSKYMKNWLETYKKPALKPTSYDRLDDQQRLYIDANLGMIQMQNLRPDDIQNLLSKLSSRYSHSTVKKVYMQLSACLSHAVAMNDLKYNPMSPVVVPKQKEFTKKEIAILTDEEIDRFVTEATKKYKTNSYYYRIGWAYVLLLFTGLRTGELLALKWTDINECEPSLKVSRNIVSIKNRSGNEDEPHYITVMQTAKTQSSQNRVVPLCKKALESLAVLKQINGNHEYICATESGEPTIKRNFDRTYRSICRNIGIVPTGLHSLRHTFASLLFKRGADIKTVSEILGHADTKITYNTYVHLLPEQKKSAIALLDSL